VINAECKFQHRRKRHEIKADERLFLRHCWYVHACSDTNRPGVDNGRLHPQRRLGEPDKSNLLRHLGKRSAIYVLNGGKLLEVNPTITTTGSGANGTFATGTGATISLSDVTMSCSGQFAHGVDATFGGTVNVTNCTISTHSGNGSVIATDRDGGYINVWGSTYSAAGTDSAGVYSTGTVIVNSAHVYSTGGEAVVVEGANSAILTNCAISGVKGSRDRGIFIYQSMSGDSTGYLGAFTMVGGSYTWPSTSGPAFYLTNTKGTVFLKNVAITNYSPLLIQCTTNQWGTVGTNGGTVNFTTEGETLTGGIVCDSYSTNIITLHSNSVLLGYINPAYLTLDASSSWFVTSNSVLNALTNAGEYRKHGRGVRSSGRKWALAAQKRHRNSPVPENNRNGLEKGLAYL
jgi:hypothetical protein